MKIQRFPFHFNFFFLSYLFLLKIHIEWNTSENSKPDTLFPETEKKKFRHTFTHPDDYIFFFLAEGKRVMNKRQDKKKEEHKGKRERKNWHCTSRAFFFFFRKKKEKKKGKEKKPLQLNDRLEDFF